MLKLFGGTVAGVIAWVAVVTLLNLALRYGWPAYAAVEKAMTFTLPMMIARLSMSAVSSIAAGLLARRIDRLRYAPLVSGVVLLLGFLPLHYAIWDRFPVWYHLTFLTSLPVVAWLGGRIDPRSTGRRPEVAAF